MKQIHESSLSYRFVLWYVKLGMRLYYNRIVVSGTKNLPKNGRFIFAPNHRNALLDAFSILYITPKGKTSSFLARADLFKKPLMAKVMRFSKIMPAFRMRDGFEHLTKNNDTFNESVDVLLHNQALCIFPEGNQEIEERLRPLVKGIFRVALNAEQTKIDHQPVYIVPVGINYGDIEKCGKHLVIKIGPPINIAEYKQAYEENPTQTLNNLRQKLSRRMQRLSYHIDNETYYNIIKKSVDYSYVKALQIRKIKLTLLSKLRSKQIIAKNLCSLANECPEKMEQLRELCLKYEDQLQTENLQNRNITSQLKLPVMIMKSLLVLLLSPLAIIGLIANALPFFSPVLIRKALKVDFIGFHSSIQFALGLISFPFFYFMQSYIISNALGLNLIEAISVAITYLPLGIISIKWYGFLKQSLAEFRYYKLPKRRKKSLKDLRNKIHSITLHEFIYNQP